jgi:FtsP/CotA-like multicopper oxidase with cupredoxin domain
MVILVVGAALGGAVLAGVLVAAWSWHASRLPGTYNVMDVGVADHGLGRGGGHGHGDAVGIERLTGEPGGPDRRFTLVAQRGEVRLRSGAVVEALTFGGTVPGPELRARRGELLEVALENRDVAAGVSLHWHGLDVPNAEDGVAGVTQDAVPPGGRHVYRFRADQVGTFWYHTHQASATLVKRGLYGAIVIEDAPDAEDLDLTVFAHAPGGRPVLDAADGQQTRVVAPGTRVRLRLLNAGNAPEHLSLSGTAFRVVAIDGTDVNGPGRLENRSLDLGAGARYDVAFTMPECGVALGLVGGDALGFVPRQGAPLPAVESAPLFDPAEYGRPQPGSISLTTRFDRVFRHDLVQKLGFFAGRPGYQWTVNGRLHKDMPVYVVRKGDRVKVTITNRSGAVHPMHLHGHHMLVLSRDGRPVRGAPWWVDTLNVLPDEVYEVAFVADNPGIWMFHCHNLVHAADGLSTHLVYEGFSTPFEIGGRARNRPE